MFIPTGVHYISAFLHMPIFGSLFKQFETEPIVTFSKCCVDAIRVDWIERPTFSYELLSKKIKFKSHFTGVNHLLMRIVPSGFDEVLYEEIISQENNIEFSISNMIFNSYNILLFKPQNDAESEFETKSFYNTPSIRISSPFMKRKLEIDEFILEDGTRHRIDNNYFFTYKIERFNNKNMLSGCIEGMNDRVILDNMFIEVLSFNEKRASGNIYKKKDDDIGLIKLKSVNKRIIGVVLKLC